MPTAPVRSAARSRVQHLTLHAGAWACGYACCIPRMPAQVWDAKGKSRTPRYGCRATLKGHKKLVYSLVAVSEDYLASSSLDWSVRVWDIGSGYVYRATR